MHPCVLQVLCILIPCTDPQRFAGLEGLFHADRDRVVKLRVSDGDEFGMLAFLAPASEPHGIHMHLVALSGFTACHRHQDRGRPVRIGVKPVTVRDPVVSLRDIRAVEINRLTLHGINRNLHQPVLRNVRISSVRFHLVQDGPIDISVYVPVNLDNKVNLVACGPLVAESGLGIYQIVPFTFPVLPAGHPEIICVSVLIQLNRAVNSLAGHDADFIRSRGIDMIVYALVQSDPDLIVAFIYLVCVQPDASVPVWHVHPVIFCARSPAEIPVDKRNYLRRIIAGNIHRRQGETGIPCRIQHIFAGRQSPPDKVTVCISHPGPGEHIILLAEYRSLRRRNPRAYGGGFVPVVINLNPPHVLVVPVDPREHDFLIISGIRVRNDIQEIALFIVIIAKQPRLFFPSVRLRGVHVLGPAQEDRIASVREAAYINVVVCLPCQGIAVVQHIPCFILEDQPVG